MLPSCVYWIHTAEQTDIFTQGYVGVSVQGALKRFRIHKSDTKKGSRLPVHNVIRKYGNNIIVDVILYADPEYCYSIEAKLRPQPNIGYNVSAGGAATNLGSKHSEETKKKISEAGKGRVCSEDTKLLHTANSTGRLHTEETKAKMSAIHKALQTDRSKAIKTLIEYSKSLPPWKNPIADINVWNNADKFYNYCINNPEHGVRKMASNFGLVYSKLAAIHKKIKSGWNPLLDKDWLILSSKLTPDASGDKSLNSDNSDNKNLKET